MATQTITEPMRLTVNLSGADAEALRAFAEQKHLTISDAVRLAISTVTFLSDWRNAGATVLIQQRNGKLLEAFWPWEEAVK